KAHVHDPSALVEGVVEPGDHGGGRAPAAVVQDLHRHHLRVPGHAAEAEPVVTAGGDDARHGRAVPEAVGRVAVPDHRVGPVDVVDEAVAVVVDRVARNLARVR